MAEIPDLGEPHHVIDHSGIRRRLWPATCGGVAVWVMTHELDDVVELFAAVKLRDELGVDDGDELEVICG